MRLSYLVLIVSALLFIGCGGMRVESDYDTEYNYAAMKYYQWADIDENEKDNVLTVMPEVYERARIAVNRSLNAKGYKIAVNEEPDFLVDVYLGIDEINDLVDNRPGGRGSRGGDLDIQKNVVREGTIIVDIITADDTYVIWRGMGLEEISDPDEYETKEQKQLRADHIIYQVLKEFPPD